jgi:methionine-rich copper-binding protein CopC
MTPLFIGLSRAVRCCLLSVVLGMLLPVAWLSAHAHAVITEDSLAREPVKPGEATHVRLQFNTGVEIKLSRVMLVSKGDTEQAVVIQAGSKPGQLLVSLPALVEGDYALRCQVFAADGHLTQEIRRFRVGAAAAVK